ncbi:MAG: substrate-binding domain-containing protein [Candidatus Acetothermia bacterium]|jgi:phosphate transport system substrate-binding protein|nr:substrate-binding domain-containing protein [Candidatus Acetothermia bacterium]MDH7504669.1 substrate-binding domain-containing protein [Candidatus Acetothermia bacterium]
MRGTIGKALFLSLLLLALGGCKGERRPSATGPELAGTITISGAWALYPMVVRWGEEFQKLHPQVQFDISAGGAGKGMADVLGKLADIGMVSRQVYPVELAKGARAIAVVRDAVLPVVNRANPVLQRLLSRGVKHETFVAIWVDGTVKTWGEVVGDPAATDPLNVYTRSDACGAAQTWAEYLGYDQEDLRGIGVYGDPGLAEAVARDPLGIGYNNLNYAYDPGTGEPAQGIVVLPIDADGDGLVDPEEGPYRTKAEATRAVAEGWYPSPPARDLYLVTLGKPAGLVQAFLIWALTDGQAFVSEAGYIRLSEERIARQLEELK